MEKKIDLGRSIGEITNGNVFDCIGHDRHFAPVVYFKKDDFEKEKVMDALTCYFDKYTDHLNVISPFLDEEAYTFASKRIHAIACKEAEEFYATIEIEVNGYLFSWLPVAKKK